MTTSLWDRLPPELIQRIYSFADPLTQYFIGYITPQQLARNQRLSVQVWVSAFQNDWDGDLLLLPHTNNAFFPIHHGLTLVKSRSMYHRLRALQQLDKSASPLRLDSLMLFLHEVPLRNCWHDLIAKMHIFKQIQTSETSLRLFRNMVIDGVHLDYFKYLVEQELMPVSRYQNLLTSAARFGYPEVVKYIYATHPKVRFSKRDMDTAATNGHLQVIKFIQQCELDSEGQRAEGCSEKAMTMAAVNGHLEVVKWLKENRSEGCCKHVVRKVASNGSLKVVKYLVDVCGKSWSSLALYEASRKGHLDLVEYFHGPACSNELCHPSIAYIAAARGRVGVFKYLYENCIRGNVLASFVARIKPGARQALHKEAIVACVEGIKPRGMEELTHSVSYSSMVHHDTFDSRSDYYPSDFDDYEDD
jgi:hypothetical protein